MTLSFNVTGDQAIRTALRKWMDPEMRKRLQDASKAGAMAFKAPMRAEASQVSKRLGRSVSVRKVSRGAPGSIVYFRKRVAFFRHFIVGGTKDHGPRKASLIVFMTPAGDLVRAKRVRGVQANPIPERIFGSMSGAAATAIVASLKEEA